MKTPAIFAAILLSLPSAATWAKAPPLSAEKAELMGRVEDVFLHNFRDITWRKSVEWGDVKNGDDGLRTIRYTYEAMIWDKEHILLSQDFTFSPDGECLRADKVKGFPQTVVPKQVDVSTQDGMIALVEDFFGKNFRDISARTTIEWGEPAKDEQGNANIRYKYEATFRDKDKKVVEQVFTFDPSGKFVSVKDSSK